MGTIITAEMYFFGRDKQYPKECTPQVRRNADTLLYRVNKLLVPAEKAGVVLGIDTMTGTCVAGPWRPQAINERTANAGLASTHLTGEGIDLQDNRKRTFARFCLKNLVLLQEVGLWMEDPRWTAGRNDDDPWVHLQNRPPRSGKRIFIPSSAPPQSGPLLPEQRI